MDPIYIDYLNAFDIEALDLSNDEILAAIETSLAAQGRGQTVIEPRVHLEPDASFHGHFNVLRGYVAPLGLAGVKVVGDYVDNYKLGYPSEFGVLNLFDPRTGVPKAILDATVITDMRTGAVTALGARHLARRVRRSSVTSARAARLTGMSACSIISSISTRSAYIRVGPKVVMPSARSWRPISARKSP